MSVAEGGAAGDPAGTADCDETDPLINPGAAEVCDGEDNDCVGGADDGLSTTVFYVDMDGDLVGAGAGTAYCANPVQDTRTAIAVRDFPPLAPIMTTPTLITTRVTPRCVTVTTTIVTPWLIMA